MLAFVMYLTMTAAPKNCGDDFGCLADAVASCGPAEAKSPVNHAAQLERRLGIESSIVTHYSIAPTKSADCKVALNGEVIELHFTKEKNEELVGQGKSQIEILQLEKKMLAFSRAQIQLKQECLTPKKILEKALRGLPGSYNSEDWKSCHSTTCGPMMPAAKGCKWSECRDGKRQLTCKKGKQKFVCDSMDATVSAGVVADCESNGSLSFSSGN
jgi:hypothetical protein